MRTLDEIAADLRQAVAEHRRAYEARIEAEELHRRAEQATLTRQSELEQELRTAVYGWKGDEP